MDKGLLWASGVSLVGLATMGIVALVVEPPVVPLAGLAERLGATVTVDGTITSLDPSTTGFSRLRLSADNVSIELVVEGAVNASAGDRARATGQVGTFGGRIQLQLQSPADLVVTLPWHTNHVDLSQILRQPWSYRDTHVLTSGDIQGGHLLGQDGESLALQGHGAARGRHLVQGLLEFQSDGARFRLVVEQATPL